MATRTALLNGNVINRDTDFSKHIEAVSEPGIISGFAVSSSSVAIGTALVKCERTNGDIIYAVVYNNSAQSISGDGDVYIEIPQELIDNGELMNEDGSEIAEIKVGTMPVKNALKLATKSGSTITDTRNMIKKSGELLTLINTNTTNISSLDTRVSQLEEADAINHLEESEVVGELYTLSNDLFRQGLPDLADCSSDCNVGDITANQYIHIQRLGSGTANNQIKLKVKKVGSPTTNLIVEVRKGTAVTVTANTEAYWYGGGDLVASGSIAYGNISTSYAEKTITLDANFGGTRGELLDVVVYQTSGTVNNTNYYVIAYDNSQYSEALSYVKVNGNTRTRTKYIPYCYSSGFSQYTLAKYGTVPKTITLSSIEQDTDTTLYTAPRDCSCSFSASLYNSSGSGSSNCYLKVNGQMIKGFDNGNNGTMNCSYSWNINAGDVVTVSRTHGSYGYGSLTDISFTANEPKAKSDAIPLKPIEVKGLGQIGYATLYGTHTDGKYYGGVMTGTASKATTGSISLGNAVGYITVNLNGEIVKIPYYGN